MNCTYTTKKDLHLSGGVMFKGTILYLEPKIYGVNKCMVLRSADGRKLSVKEENLYEYFKLIFHLQIDLL